MTLQLRMLDVLQQELRGSGKFLTCNKEKKKLACYYTFAGNPLSLENHLKNTELYKNLTRLFFARDIIHFSLIFFFLRKDHSFEKKFVSDKFNLTFANFEKRYHFSREYDLYPRANNEIRNESKGNVRTFHCSRKFHV